MSKIACELCGKEVHSIKIHVRDDHPEMTMEEYQKKFPEAPLLSELAKEKVKEKAKTKVKAKKRVETKKAEVGSISANESYDLKPLDEVFGLGEDKGALSKRGDQINIRVLKDGKYSEFVPPKDDSYVFNSELLKSVLMGLELNIPIYLWGHAGVGKSTVLEQVAAHTNSPYMRVQHTANTEESHIVGQMLANSNGTYFEPGPLALAMRNGWVYNADEYDFAHASVLGVYQPVLEGKSLIIKEAPPEWRIVRPHEAFRFVATGNTNGSGDETGLYIGTNLGNAANYSRFGIVENVLYMSSRQETMVISSQAGVVEKDAEKLVEFATGIRKAYDAGNMSATIGPRELIYAARIGFAKGSWVGGLSLAFINRLGSVDRETASAVAQRIFG